jgi:hypothetical protein
MIRNKLFTIVAGCLFLVGCTVSNEERGANFSDSLIVVSGAQKIQYTKFEGTDQLLFEIKVDYPAKTVLEEISEKLKSKGWQPLSEDYLNPGLPSSHVRGWTDFIDGTKSPRRKVYQWLAQWENKNGDILWCTLKYSYPLTAKPDLEDLTVSEAFWPAKLASEARKQAVEIISDKRAPLGLTNQSSRQ